MDSRLIYQWLSTVLSCTCTYLTMIFKRVSISFINNESIFVTQSDGLLPLKGLQTKGDLHF